jgi:hypothetical protein
MQVALRLPGYRDIRIAAGAPIFIDETCAKDAPIACDLSPQLRPLDARDRARILGKT